MSNIYLSARMISKEKAPIVLQKTKSNPVSLFLIVVFVIIAMVMFIRFFFNFLLWLDDLRKD